MREAVHVSVDTGGTFTDVVLQSSDGTVRRCKLLSTGAVRDRVCSIDDNRVGLADAARHGHDFTGYAVKRVGVPDSATVVTACVDGVLQIEQADEFTVGDIVELSTGEAAPSLGVRLITGTGLDKSLPPTSLRLGTTRGTNALLERQCASVAFFTTEGFRDLLRIGTQQRPDIFAFPVVIDPPIHEQSFEVTERVDATGQVVQSLDPEQVRRLGRDALAAGCTSASVALLHAWANDAHEREVETLLRDCGFEHVSRSSELSPTIRIVPRAQAAVIDAAIEPIVGSFLGRVRSELGSGSPDLLVMGSGGGLTASCGFHAKDALLSGPAGGVAGAVAVGRAWGFDRMLTFDMGGTSTDVSRYDHGFVYTPEQHVGPACLSTVAIDVHTVAAGGGSVCHVEDGLLEVGPHSGGADPGPACYGQGGPLCLTDVDLLAGRLVPDRFGVPIHEPAAEAALAAVCASGDGNRTPAAVLDALLARADRRMADAVGQVSLRQGCDPSEFVLVAFGGAGAQHACAVADALNMDRVLLPAGASVLSAEGIAGAAVERSAVRQMLHPLDDVIDELPALIESMAAVAGEQVVQSGIDSAKVHLRRAMLHLRLEGQDSTITVDWTAGCDPTALFHERFNALYGYPPPARTIELESLHVIAGTLPVRHPLVELPEGVMYTGPMRTRRIRFDGEWLESALVDRAELQAGDRLDGPALLCDAMTTAVLAPGWSAVCGVDGSLLLRRGAKADALVSKDAESTLERHADAFTAVASDMGAVLDRCAISVNVKERRDYSCTLHDPEGRLVVNAPHLPVHLGSMGVCVRRVAESIDCGPGDVILTNHPAFGGSHLPDLTVITPVHDGDILLGWTASRAHHAELGGTRPGSMPPEATSLIEEGVVLPPMKIVEAGRSCFEALERHLTAPPWPTRALADNLADVQAAVAANQRGAIALRALAKTAGAAAVINSMNRLQDRAAALARQMIAELPDGHFEAAEQMDDGTDLVVGIDIEGERMRVDFTGSADVHPGNLNATDAIVRSVVLYVLRLLVARRVPLNEGLLSPVELVIPEGILSPTWHDDPALCPAVVGGNVETSQRLVDLLLKALGCSAAGQGTMNNTLFGTDAFGYYETLGGGHGAMPMAHGASGVHCHMSNTRITDPEILEHRFPVRLHRFGLRIGSGGAGRRRGGDGLERVIEFLQPVSLSMLTQHRTRGPFGMDGGDDGQPGEQYITHGDGTIEVLSSSDARELAAGDRLTIRTPGGGGWGMPGTT